MHKKKSATTFIMIKKELEKFIIEEKIGGIRREYQIL